MGRTENLRLRWAHTCLWVRAFLRSKDCSRSAAKRMSSRSSSRSECSLSVRFFIFKGPPHPDPLPASGARASGLFLARFALRRLEELVAFAKAGVDCLRRAGVQAEPTGLDAAGRIELVGRRGKPGPGRAHRDAGGIVGTP